MAKDKTNNDDDDDIEKLMKESGAMSGSFYEEYTGNLPVLSTGVFGVDLATGAIDPVEGNGGIRGRDIWEVCGENGCGKSALGNSFIAATQRRYPGKSVVALFSEPPDIGRMRREGVNIEDLIILGCYHDSIEEEFLLAESSLNSLLKFAEKPSIKACVVDSVAALCTESQVFNPNGKERDLFDSQPVAGMAKIFNKFVQDFARKSKVAPLLLINHYRDAITTGPSFVPPSQLRLKTPGGRTKEFLSNIRILATSNPIWADGGKKHSVHGARIQSGLEINYKIFKNKYANPDGSRLAKVTFNFSESTFTNEDAILNFATFFAHKEGAEWKSPITPLIYKAGAWIFIGDKKFQGEEKALAYLKEDKEFTKKVEKQLIPLANRFYGDIKEGGPGLE